MMLWAVFQGVFAFGLIATIYVVALKRGMPETEVRALTFFSLVISIVALIFVNRSISASLFKAIWRPNWTLAAVLPVVAVMLAVTLLWSPARALFRFGPLHADDLSLALGVGIVVLIVLELLKWLWRRGKPNEGACQ
jgi:Ca2+-transporting ATPase